MRIRNNAFSTNAILHRTKPASKVATAAKVGTAAVVLLVFVTVVPIVVELIRGLKGL